MEDEIVYFEVKNEKGYQVLGHVDTKLLQEGGDMVKYALIYYDGVETHKIPSYIPNSPMKTSFLTVSRKHLQTPPSKVTYLQCSSKPQLKLLLYSVCSL